MGKETLLSVREILFLLENSVGKEQGTKRAALKQTNNCLLERILLLLFLCGFAILQQPSEDDVEGDFPATVFDYPAAVASK